VSLFRSRERRQWAPEPVIPPFPGVDMFGSTVPTMTSAMRVSAVWACVRLLADTVSMMPLNLYTMQNGIRVQIEPTPNEQRLLTQPGGDATMPDFLYQIMVSALLRGNVFATQTYGSDGYLRQVDVLNPDALDVSVDSETGSLVIKDHRGNSLPPRQVWRMAAYRMPGMKLGLAPISYAATTLLTDAEVQKFALGYFRDALHPTSTLVSDQSITQADARSVLDRIMAKKDAREPLILGAGLKFQPISVSPNESQFLETQKYSVATICRIFGVPPEMVAAEAGNSMTYSNVEQRAIDFLTYSIQPWLTRIETSMATWFAGSKHPRFDTSVLLRTDIETFMKAASMAIAAKIHDPNEIRAMRDYPALTQEQKDLLELVPLTISPTGRPISSPPGADTGINFGEDNSNGN
jgi:HK97 family phage portal protein